MHAGAEDAGKAPGMAKETYSHIKRNLFICQKRPNTPTKQTGAEDAGKAPGPE